ncbi:heat shock transcription factor 2 [Fistulifera solaris]|uniref:Heat shock transcription factor 2 n=1 Tax=Fistulifera solaris TaxID=1519565 RepID=A0A1Z5J7R7_FISSO|nr:heat shock transcription factor 2 [Fistulifera solaris]|eukprot:GAX09999.1 heat shock transcription factor 2 [Fistulifera solaris]
MTTKASDISQDVPIFLRKTFHMIDTCDASIAGWSDDGETFVVKDPVKFERTIIPQFFKHSKFSSFVRQLNFYSFRKIKYVDSIRIDPKLEAETANFWRFRHENFRKGRPDLLTEIKRMNGQKSSTSPSDKAPTKEVQTIEFESSTEVEVQTLKKRIEEMTKNIDSLTAMVEKVSLKQEEQGSKPTVNDNVPVGSKRVKMDVSEDEDKPDAMLSNMDLDDMVLPVLSIPEPEAIVHRETTDCTQVSDNQFVDELFNAFTEDDEDLLIGSLHGSSQSKNESWEESNRPDPEMMNRLSNALALLPKDLQCMIVDRLIAAIMSSDALENNSFIAAAIQDAELKKVLPADVTPATPEEKTKPFNVAAATLAAMLHHYNSQVKEKHPKSEHKSIPVIPVHA